VTVRRKFEKLPEVDQLLIGLVSRQDRLDRNLFTGLASRQLLVWREAVVGRHGGWNKDEVIEADTNMTAVAESKKRTKIHLKYYESKNSGY
jgi:hypothetical protein